MSDKERLADLSDRLVMSAFKVGVEALPKMTTEYALQNVEALIALSIEVDAFVLRLVRVEQAKDEQLRARQ